MLFTLAEELSNFLLHWIEKKLLFTVEYINQESSSMDVKTKKHYMN